MYLLTLMQFYVTRALPLRTSIRSRHFRERPLAVLCLSEDARMLFRQTLEGGTRGRVLAQLRVGALVLTGNVTLDLRELLAVEVGCEWLLWGCAKLA